jgi:hypothetical protein
VILKKTLILQGEKSLSLDKGASLSTSSPILLSLSSGSNTISTCFLEALTEKLKRGRRSFGENEEEEEVLKEE